MVRCLSGPGLPGLALFGRAGPKKVRPPLDVNVEFLLEFVEPGQADVTPGSNVVVPDVNGDRVRLSGTGFCGHCKPFVQLTLSSSF